MSWLKHLNDDLFGAKSPKKLHDKLIKILIFSIGAYCIASIWIGALHYYIHMYYSLFMRFVWPF